MAGQPMRLSLAITADASGVAPATAEARREIESVGKATEHWTSSSRRVAIANDEAAAASRRATEAIRGQSAAERDLRAAASSFAGVRSPMNDNEYRQRATDVQAYGDALDRLRARYNPLFAATRSYLQSREEIRSAHRVGAISANEMSEALSRERQATLASIAAIKSRNAAIADTPAMRFATSNIAAQFQDIGVTTAMGMSPIQIALQQGTQLSAVLEQMRGTGQSAGAALLGAFTSIISPVSLVTIGVIGLTAAAVQYFTDVDDGAEANRAALEAELDLIRAVADRWGETLPVVKAYADARQRIADIQEAEDATAATISGGYRDATDTLRSFIGEVDAADFSAFDAAAMTLVDNTARLQEAVGDLEQAQKDGKDTTEEFGRVQQVLAEIVGSAAIPATGELRDLVNDLARAYQDAGRQAGDAAGNFSLLNDRGGIPISDVEGGRGSDPRDLEKDPYWRSRYLPDPERAARAPRARRDQASPYDRALNSADDRIAQMQTEIQLLGRVGAEVEALRYEQELLNRATDEGKTLDEKQIEAIKAKAEEYGRLKSELAATRLEQDLMFERDQMFRSPTEQRVAASLRSAGVEASSPEGQRLAEIIRVNEQLAFGRDLANDFGNSLVQAFSDGKLEGEELLRIIMQIIQQLLNAPGGLVGFVSSIFGGGAGAFPGAPAGLGLESGIGLFDSGGTIRNGDVVPFGPNTRRLRNGAVLADSGLGSRHFKAVLEEGETVLTRDMTNRAMNVMGSAAGGTDGVLRLVLEPSRLFDVRMEEVSGNVAQRVSVETVTQYDKSATQRFNRDAQMSKRLGAR